MESLKTAADAATNAVAAYCTAPNELIFYALGAVVIGAVLGWVARQLTLKKV